MKKLILAFIALFSQQTLAQTKFVCPNTGLFLDPESPNCAHYYKCIVSGTKEVVKIRYKCALNFVFNDKLNVCVSQFFYRCPFVPPSATTSAPPTASIPFVCPASGDFPNDMSVDCKHYFFCTRAGDLARPAVCPGTSIFNWALRACLPSDSFGCALQSGPFECPTVGHFVNPNSSDGSTYYTCFVHWTGEILHQTGICRNGEVYYAAEGCRPRKVVNTQ